MVRHEVTGLLTPAGEPDAMAAALLRLHQDGALRQRLGAAGRRRVEEHFDIRQMVRTYEDLYKTLGKRRTGVALEQSGNELANRWGINGVVFGATILAAVTALPEISSGIRAVRLGQVGLAMGDIFGGNQVQMTLFLVADLLAGKPVLQSVQANSSWLGGVGVVVTAIFAAGLVLRPPKKLALVGPDSLLVLVAYAIGLAGLVRIT